MNPRDLISRVETYITTTEVVMALKLMSVYKNDATIKNEIGFFLDNCLTLFYIKDKGQYDLLYPKVPYIPTSPYSELILAIPKNIEEMSYWEIIGFVNKILPLFDIYKPRGNYVEDVYGKVSYVDKVEYIDGKKVVSKQEVRLRELSDSEIISDLKREEQDSYKIWLIIKTVYENIKNYDNCSAIEASTHVFNNVCITSVINRGDIRILRYYDQEDYLTEQGDYNGSQYS